MFSLATVCRSRLRHLCNCHRGSGQSPTASNCRIMTVIVEAAPIVKPRRSIKTLCNGRATLFMPFLSFLKNFLPHSTNRRTICLRLSYSLKFWIFVRFPNMNFPIWEVGKYRGKLEKAKIGFAGQLVNFIPQPSPKYPDTKPPQSRIYGCIQPYPKAGETAFFP